MPSMGQIPNLEYIQNLSKVVQERIPMEVKKLLMEIEEYDRYLHIALRHRMCPKCGGGDLQVTTWMKIQSFVCKNCGFKHGVNLRVEPFIPHVTLGM